MDRFKHIDITEPGELRRYTHVSSGGGGEYRVPPRDDRVGHGQRLQRQIQTARAELGQQASDAGHTITDVALEVVGPRRDLQLASLERLRNGLGVELRAVADREGRSFATVYVPSSRLESFVRLFERYTNEDRVDTRRPKNEPLVAGIDEIRTPVLRSFWTDADDLFPADQTAPIWWEVWLQKRIDDEEDTAFIEFISAVDGSGLRVGSHVLRFNERLVFHVHGTVEQWTCVFVPLLDRLAELRKAKEVASEFLRLQPRDQRLLIEDLVQRLSSPAATAPAVCVLDHGVSKEHPLLAPFLSPEDQHVIEQVWTRVDNREQHGSEMAGIALYGQELPYLLGGDAQPLMLHRLESVRILNTSQAHPEETWGWVTQEGVALAEQAAPDRSRVVLLAITADDRGRDHGYPTSWSAAIDQSAAGELDGTKRLFVVSAGNVRSPTDFPAHVYPNSNIEEHRIEDPAQAWNALTVGACTDLIQIRDASLDSHSPLAKQGELCPASRTSASWPDQEWPIKPDIVMEGGNYTRSPEGSVHATEDLCLLTASGSTVGNLLSWTSDTSAASAQAARLAAILQAEYPHLWPETLRALLVHSASWTSAMIDQVPGVRQSDRHKRLRCFGYGRPDLDRARYTLRNRVALIHQGQIQAFERVRENGEWKNRTKDFSLHSLPWPAEALAALHARSVHLRVTLSYFIEPSPGRRGWKKKFRYQSHGLRFKLRGPTETDEEFRQRISQEEWDEDSEGRPSVADPIPWALGSNLQTKGSIHSDWWEATGAELAACGQIAVYPVTGWWRERPHLGKVDSIARYALVVTIETDAEDCDLYTPVMDQITAPLTVEA